MMAVVLSLVYRQIPGLREVQRVLKLDGLLWVEQISVSVQALSLMLRTLPIELFTTVFEHLMDVLSLRIRLIIVPETWKPVCERFTAIWIADGSTLEALRLKLKALKEQDKTLAGKIMVVVEAFTHRPVTTSVHTKQQYHLIKFGAISY